MGRVTVKISVTGLIRWFYRKHKGGEHTQTTSEKNDPSPLIPWFANLTYGGTDYTR